MPFVHITQDVLSGQGVDGGEDSERRHVFEDWEKIRDLPSLEGR